jgi:hypothetical protein
MIVQGGLDRGTFAKKRVSGFTGSPNSVRISRFRQKQLIDAIETCSGNAGVS